MSLKPFSILFPSILIILILPFLIPQPKAMRTIEKKIDEMPLPEGDVYYDISYGRNGFRRQKLDIYLPLAEREEAPVLVYIHGGSWLHGDKSAIRYTDRFLRTLRSTGFTVISIDYTASLYGGLQVPLDNCVDALEWVGDHGEDYGYGTGNIGMYGVSAGAHLSLMAAATAVELSYPIRFILEECGPTDLEAMKGGDAFSSSSFFKLFTENSLAKMSPVHYAEDLPMPLMIVHGTADETVSLNQAHLMRDALRKAGFSPIYLEIEGGNHGFFNCVEKWPFMEKAVLDFMENSLIDAFHS
ncbi:MAG: alpha/beta hydrolase [Spirochaetales bacterium]|nr:alpha/beta hydrolase [Spirochaetales bacterium]